MRAAGLLFSAWLSLAAGAAELSPVAGALEYGLRPRPVAPDTYVVEGRTEHFSRDNGGNIVNTGFIVTDAGVVVIDTGPSRLYGKQLREAIARITDQPVVRVYNTHHHPDHFLGNQAFRDVAILATAETRRGIETEGPDFASNMYRLAGDWMRGTELVVPTATVQSGEETLGGHRLAFFTLAGHTGSDLAVFDHTTGVLFAGDLVFNRRAPTTPHARIDAWLDSLERLAALDFKVLVPGHGPVVADSSAIAATADYLRWLTGSLAAAADSGQAMAEVLYRPLPERFRDLAVLRGEYMRSVAHLFPALERRALEAAGREER